MPAIHFVERLNNVFKLKDGSDDYESGYWKLAEETAAGLVGGDLYLHSGQSAPSHFGGKVIGYRVHRDGSSIDGRIVFRIKPSVAYKGVPAGRERWRNEMKIVW
jgi:hypothetical protein